MLELLPRVPFGPANDPAQCAPWPQPVSAFNLGWLKGVFTPAQRDRLTRVTDAIDTANTQIEKVRSQAVNPIEVGNRLANGTVLRTANDSQLEHTVRTHAAKQVVAEIIKIRNATDPIIVPILKDMARASLTADTLRQRVFDKISCLSRAGTSGMKAVELAAFKASIMTVIHQVSAIELNRMIQAVIDDGSGDSLPTLDCLRMVNFARPKDERGALNARLIELASVPEFNEAGPLLDEVQTANQTALKLHAQFRDHSAHARVLKMTSGFSKLGQQVHPIGAE